MAIAVGDIHGCLSTLKRLIARLPSEEQLVFLGDYVDRGPDSAGVVDYLKTLARRRPCTFLKGNHEDMMLHAVRDKDEIPVWLINGGEATLRSYGMERLQWSDCAERGAFLQRDMDFFAALQPYHEDEYAVYVHAGVDPGIADMSRQDPKIMLWVRDKFYRFTEQWRGKMIVFGHTPTRHMGLQGKEVFRAERACGIDTGCVYGGYLTAFDPNSGALYQEKSDFTY